MATQIDEQFIEHCSLIEYYLGVNESALMRFRLADYTLGGGPQIS